MIFFIYHLGLAIFTVVGPNRYSWPLKFAYVKVLVN